MALQTHKRCRACTGDGGRDVRHHSGNPELETWRACSQCGGTGWIQFVPTDVLICVAEQRRTLLRFGREQNMAWLSGTARRMYHDVRATAMKPVKLPKYVKPASNVHPLFAQMFQQLGLAA